MTKRIILTTTAAIASIAAFAQTPMPKTIKPELAFKSTADGLQYNIVKDAPGTNKPKIGDHIEIHINTHVGDSMLYDSRKLNDNKPVPLQLMPPSFKGDLTEGFMMMTPGDSAVFRVAIDSIVKSGQQMLPWMKPGDMIQYEVVMVSVKTTEALKKEQEEKSAKQKDADEKLLKEYLKKNKITATRTASGLYYKINTPGSGDNAKVGQQVTVNYTGKTMDGNTFDSNVDPAFSHVQPFSFELGRGMVIRGWDEGVALLKKGGKATLYIPSGLAYGERSPSPKIPANAILIFDVEVTDIADKAAPAGHSKDDGHNH